MTPASSPSYLGCTLSCPMDLCMLVWHKCSPDTSCSAMDAALLPQMLVGDSRTREVWEQILPGEEDGKKGSVFLSLFQVLVTTCPAPLSHETIFSSADPLCCQCTYRNPSGSPPHPLLVPAPAELWLSWVHPCTHRPCVYLPPGRPISPSTPCALPSRV